MHKFHSFFQKHPFLCACCIFSQAVLFSSFTNEKKNNAHQNRPSSKGSLVLITNNNDTVKPEGNAYQPKFKADYGKHLKGQEALLLKRITEYWKDGDYSLAKSQILEFLSKYPESSAKDGILAMLGDLFFQENRYREAVSAYSQITNEELKNKVFFNQVQSLFELEEYQAVTKLTSGFFKKEQNVEPEKNLRLHLLHAESLFRMLLASKEPAQQQSLARLAKAHYKILEKTPYEDLASFPLAEIYRILKEYPKAADQYILLSKKHPDKEEELLFQAASLQVKYNKSEAISTFAKICSLNGKKLQAASYDLMVLLFQENRFKELVSIQDQVLQSLSKEQTPLIYFFLGRSHFELKNYRDAAVAFEHFIQTEEQKTTKLKTALLSTIICAESIQDLPLFGRNLKLLMDSFPNDPECAKALAKHAQLSFVLHDLKQAEEDLRQIIDKFPEYGQKESMTYDLALLQFMDKKWDAARSSFLSFIEQFPSSSRKTSAERLALDASLEAIKEGNGDLASLKKDNLIIDLKTILKQDPQQLDAEELRECHFLLIKTMMDQEKYAEAVPYLGDYITAYLNHPTEAEAHLFIAACLLKQKLDLKEFSFHAERALELNPELQKQKNIHLQLFNAYLKLAESENEGRKQSYFQQAAAHLYSVYSMDESSIKKENLLWLSNFYYQNAKEDPTALSRAINTLETILNLSEQGNLSPSFFTPETIYLETETMKLAELFSMQNKPQKRIALLESLTAQQQRHPEYEWKFLRRSLFELAISYEAAYEQGKALQAYDHLIQSASHATSYLSNAALLQRTRIYYSMLKDEEKNESNPNLIEILNNLKDLQIKKKLYSEPIHLEAALDYADIRISLVDPQLKNERALFFFKRIKEDFTTQKDLLSKDYNAARDVFPEKAVIFESYMQYIDAEIQKIEGLIAIQNQQIDKGQELKKGAEGQFEELLKKHNGLTPYLQNRIETSMHELKTTL
ncbi:MAG TPA: tetratricopeptide repeat protein [Rhabdochlamydiaceae bacterium]|nr:tetratricopeptide repeat protein [Rhabdochlamydiaceae bacterium]HSX14245.1 tetratricopeptide repeat protein [Chlamydiales bacterium]